MFKEILKIKPQVDNGDLRKMESTLNRRFGKVAKKFGRGLLNAVKGAGIVGLALSVIDKIINPLQAVQESIDRILKQGDDLVTFSKQFGTTAGRLAKLEAFGKATGVQSDFLFQNLAKFQTRVAEAEADPKKQTSVRNFTGRGDTAQAFFDFIQGLQKVSANDRTLAVREVFGEDAAVRLADFISADFEKLNKQFFSQFSAEKLTQAAEKAGGLSDLKDALGAQRGLGDLINKSREINEGMIRAQDRRERAELERETQRIQSYKSLSTISEASTQIMTLLEGGLVMLGNVIEQVTGLSKKINELVGYVKKLSVSRIWRGIFGGGD